MIAYTLIFDSFVDVIVMFHQVTILPLLISIDMERVITIFYK